MYDSLSTIKEYNDLKRELMTASAPFAVTGCMDSQKLQLTAELSSDYKWTLFITPNEHSAAETVSDLRNFSETVWQYPAKDLLFYSSDIHGS